MLIVHIRSNGVVTSTQNYVVKVRAAVLRKTAAALRGHAASVEGWLRHSCSSGKEVGHRACRWRQEFLSGTTWDDTWGELLQSHLTMHVPQQIKKDIMEEAWLAMATAPTAPKSGTGDDTGEKNNDDDGSGSEDTWLALSAGHL